MLINGVDLSSLGVQLYNRVLTSNNIKTTRDWLEGDIQPTLIRQQEKFKSIQLQFLVTEKNEDDAFLVMSKLTSMLKKATVVFDDIDLLFELAALLEDNKEVDHASEYYVKIIKKDPQNKEALRKLAVYRESIGDYQGQVTYLEKLVEADANDLDALKNLGRAYEKTRANSKALELYQHYIEIVKNPADYKIIKEKIEKLQNGGADEESEGLLDKIMKIFGK